jgi:thymidylate synthase
MFISKKTVDDLLRTAFEKILKDGIRVKATKGWNTELSGVVLELQNPRARLSRTETKGTVFSCLGETLWYLAKTNELDFIEYYLHGYGKFSDDGRTIYGGYGPLFFKMHGEVDQIASVVRLLSRKRSTRQAVIQLFDAKDILKPHKDVPCTCTIQLLVRRNKLHMFTYMRSNDAYLGLPHDIFAFTFLQEILARTLGADLGRYWHATASLHLYETDYSKVNRFLKEGWQSTTIAMPAMPSGNPWPSVTKLLAAEEKIRRGSKVSVGKTGLSNYWADLVRLLQIYGSAQRRQIIDIGNDMVSDVYNAYIEKRANVVSKKRG